MTNSQCNLCTALSLQSGDSWKTELEEQRYKRLQHLLQKSSIYTNFLLSKMDEQQAKERKRQERQAQKRKEEEKNQKKEKKAEEKKEVGHTVDEFINVFYFDSVLVN